MTNKITRAARLDKLVVEKIEKMAKDQNRTFSNMLETILFDYFKLELNDDPQIED